MELLKHDGCGKLADTIFSISHSLWNTFITIKFDIIRTCSRELIILDLRRDKLKTDLIRLESSDEGGQNSRAGF